MKKRTDPKTKLWDTSYTRRSERVRRNPGKKQEKATSQLSTDANEWWCSRNQMKQWLEKEGMNRCVRSLLICRDR